MLNWLRKNSFKIIIIVVVVIVVFLINFYLQMTKPLPKVKVQARQDVKRARELAVSDPDA